MRGMILFFQEHRDSECSRKWKTFVLLIRKFSLSSSMEVIYALTITNEKKPFKHWRIPFLIEPRPNKFRGSYKKEGV